MSNTSNLPPIFLNSRDFEFTPTGNIHDPSADTLGVDSALPEWASGWAEGNFVPSAQLSTRDGRVTGNAVLMWWVVLGGIPIAVVVSDAGNVTLATHAELQKMFYTPEFLMREPLYAHLAGIAAAGVEIPDEFRFLFEMGGVLLDDDKTDDSDDDDSDFEGYVEGSNPLIEAIMASLVEPEVEEGLDFGGDDDVKFNVSITDAYGDTIMASFDTVEELNEFLTAMDIPFQV